MCNQGGYKGRLGIYEWLRLTEPLRDLVTQRAPTLVIKQKAIEQGMRTLRDDGMRAIEQHGPFVIDGDRDIMQALDALLSSFVVQQRMKLPGRAYVPCYRIRGT